MSALSKNLFAEQKENNHQEASRFLFLSNDIIISMLNFLFYFFVFLFGLSVGSFLNCLIYRLEVGENFWEGRSFCPHCKHFLSWKDLIPLFSFFILQGKCRYCSQKISWQYPLVELFTALLFVFPLFFKSNDWGFSLFFEIFFYWIFSAFLLAIFVYDLKHFLVPDEIIYPAIFFSFIYQLLKIFLFKNFQFWNLIFAFLPSFFFLSIILISKEKWMGWGDFKIALFMALILSWPKVLIAFFFSFFFGAIIGIGLILFKKKNLKSEIPFAPFLVFATFLALFFGEKIIGYYLSFF